MWASAVEGVVLLSLIGGVAVFLAVVIALWCIRRKTVSGGIGLERYLGVEKQLAALKEKSASIPGLEKRLQTVHDKAEELRDQLEEARQNEKVLEKELENERKHSAEKLKMFADAEKSFSNKFSVLADKILDEKSEKLTEESKGLFGPLKDKLEKFDKTIHSAREEDAKERQKVRSELQHILNMGLALSNSADGLTRALKGDTKTQGTWGEMVLETVLEKSGLVRGREYEVQESKKTEDGKIIRPDVLLFLPENKVIVLDAKVSLTAYERWVNSETDKDRALASAQHANSVRSHISKLSKKNYQDLVGHASLDFVLVFIPNEPALSLALSEAPDIFDFAIERNIGLVSPNLLMITLRLIENIWRTERQNQNALEIAKQAGGIYDNFARFVSVFESVGKRIDQAKESYEDSHKKLTTGRGNLVTRADKLKKLGAKTSKTLSAELVEKAGSELPQLGNLSEGPAATEKG